MKRTSGRSGRRRRHILKKAFITGITGQDGSYLVELLLDKGYEVYGMIRRSSSFNTGRIEHLYDPSFTGHRGLSKGYGKNLYLAYGDLTDGASISRLLHEIQPDEIYNLGAQSHVQVSFEQPEFTMKVNALGVLRLLEAARSLEKKPRIYQASSSEMYGNSDVTRQNELTPFNPCSPYGVSKLCAFWTARNYRESYGLFISNGILFNHESPRRGETFVTRKITRAATRIKLGLQDKLYLGNLTPSRDWGYAKNYVEAMWLMLQQDKPSDFVIATGENYTVQDFVTTVFDYLGLDSKNYVKTAVRYYRPKELFDLRGDYSQAAKVLRWFPSTKFQSLVRLMVDSDMKIAEQEKLISDNKK